MKAEELLEIIIKELVFNPEEVKIEKTVNEMGVMLDIECNPEDRKFIIGKKGTTWKALKTLIRKIGLKNHQNINLRIVE